LFAIFAKTLNVDQEATAGGKREEWWYVEMQGNC